MAAIWLYRLMMNHQAKNAAIINDAICHSLMPNHDALASFHFLAGGFIRFNTCDIPLSIKIK
ncbi:MAG: hypothetical protein SCK70_00340 [bacterium]|nr:hypothetical protein [bacterium]